MATVILYPKSDISVGHTKSSTSSNGYALVNEVTSDNGSSYLGHSLSTSSSTRTSTFKCTPNDTTIGKVIIRSAKINVRYEFYTTNTSSQTATITPSISINGESSSVDSAFTTTTTTGEGTYSTQVFNITNLSGVGVIYDSFDAANVQVTVSTSGSYVENDSKNTKSGRLRITQINTEVTYDNVYDAKAEIITGNGISSASPVSQEVMEGNSVAFSATLVSSDWKFDGWYESSDFSGNPVSTSNPYTVSAVSGDILLYPRAIPKYNINIYGDSSRFTYTLKYKSSGATVESDKSFPGEEVILSVSPTKSIYKFSSIYQADINGNKLGTHITNDNPYTFTVPNEDTNLYVEVGKEVKIFVDCKNCSLSGSSSPIISSGGKMETIALSYDSGTSDWGGIYSDSGYTNRLSQNLTYTFMVGDNDVYLYAKAIPKQAIYIKENGEWVGYSEVWVKENGVWTKKDDFEGIFDTTKNYKRIDL